MARRIGIAIGIVVAGAAVGWIARAQPTPIKRTAPVGFDHAAHAAKASVACTSCHVLARGLVGKPPGHTACFSAACHAVSTKIDAKLEPARARLCITCHAETALVLPIDKKTLGMTTVSTGIEHAAQLGHATHAKTPCSQCHDLGGKPRAGRHARCLGCHGEKSGKTFAITECAKCHPKNTDRPRFADKQIVVTSTFSHGKHAARGATKCTTCHASLAGTNANTLPRPELATCTGAGCHDGKAAFDTNARCTKCHSAKDAPKTKYEVARPNQPFSHEKHEPRGQLACAACHQLSKTGEVRIAGHAACATGACHPGEMGQRFPKICNACHDGTEPWRPLVADKLPSDVSEFGSTLDHRKHTAACASCHSLTTTRTELRAPRGHRACTTAGCHAMAGGPAPQMTACDGCHIRNLDEQRRATRLSAPWSVRAMFGHDAHTAKAGAIACEKCHTDLRSPTVLSLPAPTKATCATEKCHDGTTAFKVTGTSCTRCHRGAPK